MQRYTLSLNNIHYLVEYRKSYEMTIKRSKEFVMLRKYDVENEIAIDDSIMFIDVDSYKEHFIKEDDGTLHENNKLAFPYSNKNYTGLSSSILEFANDATLKMLAYREDNNDMKADYYNLYVKTLNNEFKRHTIECDSIRIYRPQTRKHIPSIISLTNKINNINFNYFCQKYDEQELHISKEITYNNQTYYEYIEIFVPNVEALFGSRNVYFNEDLNFYQTMSFNNYSPEYKLTNSNSADNKILLKALILPFRVEKACTKEINCDFCEQKILGTCNKFNIKNINVKTFLVDDINSIEYTNTDYNFSNIPFVLTMTPYDYVDESSLKYLSTNGISPTSIVFSQDNQFYIKSHVGFDRFNKSIISVISEWQYPNIENEFGKDNSETALQDAYFYYNKITNTSEYREFDGYDDDAFLSNFSDELIESMKFKNCGCVIEMSLDTKFKDVFYRRSAGLDNGIDDFTFNLDNIFTSWKEYPEIIFIRTIFIDKFLSKIFTSNTMALTKEKFKYCINNSDENYRINLKAKISDDNNSESMTTFNFIDKIKCIVNKHDIMKENVITIGSKSVKSSIVYKPLFFKTHDSQRIKIRQSVVQNIGINLGEYLSKVQDFKMKIEDYEFVECARNDVYVIFKIPGSYIQNVSGKYDILDANEDIYITSGEYQII